jgi:hypothetical protein
MSLRDQAEVTEVDFFRRRWSTDDGRRSAVGGRRLLRSLKVSFLISETSLCLKKKEGEEREGEGDEMERVINKN